MQVAYRSVPVAIFVVLLCAVAARADQFNWCDDASQDFVTPVKDQGDTGLCWAFSTIAAIEAKYMITRNDTSFQPDFSEQALLDEGAGTLAGGDPAIALSFLQNAGALTAAEVPFTGVAPPPDWAVDPTWEASAVRITSYLNGITGDPDVIKQDLKLYGPLVAAIQTDNDWYSPPPGAYRGAHAVLVTGYQDDPSAPGGGYWICKNSWGTSWGDAGYGEIAYSTLGNNGRCLYAINSPAYAVGPTATATWQGSGGSSSAGNWSAGDSTCWSAGGSPYAWVNQETAAVFGPGGAANPVAVSGPVFAYRLTFNPGATGYVFSGGAMTIDHGGIAANESVEIDSPVTIGAPQQWVTAAGATLTVDGGVHTVISRLTITGAGTTAISGNIDDGGAINAQGATGGGLVKQGTGTLILSGTNSYSGLTTLAGGVLQLVGAGAQAPVLSLGGADIQGGTMVFNYGSGADPAAAVSADLKASYLANWASGKIHSSTAAAGYALGWSDNAAAGQLTVEYTLLGDATLEGAVDINDLTIVLTNFGQTGRSWSQGDFQYDGAVDINDLSLVLANFGQSVGSSGAAPAAVPEPAGLVMLLGLAAAAIFYRRRR